MRKITLLTLATIAMLAIVLVPSARADDDDWEDGRHYDRVRSDRYLAVEVWTDHSDGEYYDGDNINVYFRTNRDAFVAIYSIDSKDRVNLLFPSDPNQDNFVYGGVTYSLPGPEDDYDLVITGPSGVENIQVMASRDRFPIPDWYGRSGLICDWDDRFDFMDYLNERYFVRYDGQRFAYDRTSVYVNEWEPVYFRPVYYPSYPTWMTCGNLYIDYPIGASVYINGIYWGCAPLYVPRIYVGWHTFTVYDRWGHCWEHDIHITRYNTVVLDHTVIRPSPSVASKYKEVRTVGYRDPVKAGYTDFDKRKKKILSSSVTLDKSVTRSSLGGGSKTAGGKVVSGGDGDYKVIATQKKHLKGDGQLVKTERGYQVQSLKGQSQSGYRTSKYDGSNTSRSDKSTSGYRKSVIGSSSKSTSGNSRYRSKESTRNSGYKSGSSSDGYYQKKSGSSSQKGSTYKRSTAPSNSGKSSSGSYKRSTTPGNSGKKSTGSYKRSVSPKKSTPKSNSGYKKQSVPKSSGSYKPKSSTPKSSSGSKSSSKSTSRSKSSKGKK